MMSVSLPVCLARSRLPITLHFASEMVAVAALHWSPPVTRQQLQ